MRLHQLPTSATGEQKWMIKLWRDAIVEQINWWANTQILHSSKPLPDQIYRWRHSWIAHYAYTVTNRFRHAARCVTVLFLAESKYWSPTLALYATPAHRFRVAVTAGMAVFPHSWHHISAVVKTIKARARLDPHIVNSTWVLPTSTKWTILGDTSLT